MPGRCCMSTARKHDAHTSMHGQCRPRQTASQTFDAQSHPLRVPFTHPDNVPVIPTFPRNHALAAILWLPTTVTARALAHRRWVPAPHRKFVSLAGMLSSFFSAR